MTLPELQATSLAWRRQIDPDATDATVIEHMGREVAELMAATTWANLREETADVALVLAHLAARRGWGLEEHLHFVSKPPLVLILDDFEAVAKWSAKDLELYEVACHNLWHDLHDWAHRLDIDLLEAMTEKLAIAMEQRYAGPDASGCVEHVGEGI